MSFNSRWYQVSSTFNSIRGYCKQTDNTDGPARWGVLNCAERQIMDCRIQNPKAGFLYQRPPTSCTNSGLTSHQWCHDDWCSPQLGLATMPTPRWAVPLSCWSCCSTPAGRAAPAAWRCVWSCACSSSRRCQSRSTGPAARPGWGSGGPGCGTVSRLCAAKYGGH